MVFSFDSFVNSAISLIFPSVCQGCSVPLSQTPQPWLCPACRQRLLFITPPLCSCCGKPFPKGDNHLCGECLAGAFSFDLARSLVAYNKPVVRMISNFKYNKRLGSLFTISALCAEVNISSWFCQPDFIIPVPLHISKLRKRGFNQSLLVARKCFPSWQQLVAPRGLVKSKATVAQVSLSGKERRTSLTKTFKVNTNLGLEGKSILLVDDVLTTGSTLNACSKVLKRAGAVRVEAFTIARALSRADHETTFGKETTRKKIYDACFDKKTPQHGKIKAPWMP